MGSPHDMLREAVSLALLALRDQKESGCVDEETYRFFIPVSLKTQTPYLPPPKHVSTVESQKLSGKPVSTNLPERPQATPLTSEPIQSHEQPSTPEVPVDITLRRREKLLPHAFGIESVDLSSTRKALAQSMALSEKPLYSAVEKKKQWAIFTSLASSDADRFVFSVVKAIEERFHIRVCRFDCSSPTFSIDLQLSASDCQIVFLFVESHLETTLLKQIEAIRAFQKKPAPQNPPFTRIGEMLSAPLLLLPLHPQIATDTTTKQQLWTSLKSLART